jgi:hypothetical protein
VKEESYCLTGGKDETSLDGHDYWFTDFTVAGRTAWLYAGSCLSTG